MSNTVVYAQAVKIGPIGDSQAIFRQVNEIDTIFPYDIVVEDVRRNESRSYQLIKKGERPTVLLFWLTTCGPCKMELSAISAKYTSWKDQANFDFFAISTDHEKYFMDVVKRQEEAGYPFPLWHDKHHEFSHVMPGALNGLPQVFVFNKDGEITYHKRRFYSGDEDLLFEAILAAQ